MTKHSKFITCEQWNNKWQSTGELKIDPTQVSYVESVPTVNEYHSKIGEHSKIHTIYGGIIEVKEGPEEIEEIINKWYKEEDKRNVNSITISKDDLLKSFILKNIQYNK